MLVPRIQVPDRSIIEDHALARLNHVMKRGLGEIRWRDGRLSNTRLDAAVAGDGLRLDLRFVALEQDKQTSLGPCMLHRDSHEFFDQLGEHDLTGECLRGLYDSLDVQLHDRRADCGAERSRTSRLVQVRVEWVEVFHLAQGTPALVTGPHPA